MGYSKAPEQPQSSSARPICHSHTMTSTGLEPATIRIAAYRSSPHYALRHGRRLRLRLYIAVVIILSQWLSAVVNVQIQSESHNTLIKMICEINVEELHIHVLVI